MPTQAPASDPPFYGIFVPQNVPLFEKVDDVIVCDLRFGLSPQSKILATLMHLVNVFLLTSITFDWKTIIHNHIWLALALKIAKLIVAQASAQSFKNNCGASAIASEMVAAAIIAAHVPTSG